VMFFLFPGQGSQTPGMGQDFFDKSPAAREVFQKADQLADFPLSKTIFEGSADALKDTRIAQLGLLVVEVAIARHLTSLGIAPAGCAGHSLGEFSALVVAGALDFEQAVPLVQARGHAMAELAPDGAMAAVVGLEPAAIEAHLPEGAEIANYNGPQQTIISGTASAIESASEVLKRAGAKRILPLAVSGPFHSALMKNAAQAFQAQLDNVSLRRPRVRFVSSVSGVDESDPETIYRLLARQISSPVRWTQTMQTIGTVNALEIGPGKVLQGLAKRTEGAPIVALAGVLDQTDALEVNT
jgi:[acyl-carrier-protein] S-malonyltransferase